MHGRDGDDVILRVPCGTIVREVILNEEYEEQSNKFSKKYLTSLDSHNQSFLLAKGGVGGLGNYIMRRRRSYEEMVLNFNSNKNKIKIKRHQE